MLEGLGVVYLLKPYSNNQLKRLPQTPKLYFLDTGLCAYLSMWLTPEMLMNGAASGHYFENFVVIELLKNCSFGKNKINMTYYRDSNAKEIDLVLEKNQALHPLEIKRAATPDKREIKKFTLLDKSSCKRENGGIICMCEEVLPIDEKNCFIPCSLL